MNSRHGKLTSLRKLIRFSKIYGPNRAIAKALGRLRVSSMPWSSRLRHGTGVGVIGCGQFAFATIAYFLKSHARFLVCYDPSSKASESFGNRYGGASVNSSEDVIGCPGVEIVYVASNHATHTEYAIRALKAGKRVYVEKPVAVSFAQLSVLSSEIQLHGPDMLFVGYNRPFSGAIKDLRKWIPEPKGALTLSCFISGHVIPHDHWYRNAEEGTRICGNVGHWLDLAVHMLHWRTVPDTWRISLAWSDPEARDDNLAITLTSEMGDLVNIVLTARSEPFEGINETINVQWDDVIAKIDDFRKITLWQNTKLKTARYFPKDVGHKRAVLQPFSSYVRPWSEVELSSLLMLRIADMVRTAQTVFEFSFEQELVALKEAS